RDVDAYWQARMHDGRHLEDLPLYRLRRWERLERCIVLHAGHTSYKEYLGTNVAQPSWTRDSPGMLADPLAMSIVAVCSDGTLLLNRRAPKVAEYDDQFHVTPAGHIHPPQRILDAVRAELHEELAVRHDEV